MLKEEKEEIITNIVLSNIKEFAIRLGYSYLNGGYGYWEDGKGERHKISSMEDDYLENCINFVERGLEAIENQVITDIIGKHFKEFVREYDKGGLLKCKKLELTETILDQIKKGLIKTLETKKEELEGYC